MKQEKVKNYILISIFIIMICMPQIVFWFCKEYIKIDTSENRKLAEKPNLEFSTIQNYPKNFDKYYNDNLPFRGIIKKAWTNINFLLFNETTSSSVLIGKNDGNKESTWLFYKDANDGNPVREAQGITNFTEEQQNSIINSINSNTEKLKEKGIELYYSIMPNKENIYKEKLPDSIEIVDEKSRTDKVIELMKQRNINIIYPKEKLLEAKNINQVYYKQDTHWNDYGGFIGFKEIMKTIEPSYNNFNIDVTVEEEKIIYKDLTDFSGISNILKDNIIKVDYKENITYNLVDNKTKTNVIQFTTCENADIDKKIMIVGDSFRTAMIPYFSKTYKEGIYMHYFDYNPEMLEKHKPDVVIFEMVERYTNVISAFKLY